MLSALGVVILLASTSCDPCEEAVGLLDRDCNEQTARLVVESCDRSVECPGADLALEAARNRLQRLTNPIRDESLRLAGTHDYLQALDKVRLARSIAPRDATLEALEVYLIRSAEQQAADLERMARRALLESHPEAVRLEESVKIYRKFLDRFSGLPTGPRLELERPSDLSPRFDPVKLIRHYRGAPNRTQEPG